MSFDHLINRLTSPYIEGKKSVIMAEFTSDGTIYNQVIKNSLTVPAPIIIVVETNIGEIEHEFRLQFKDGDDITRFLFLVTIPPYTQQGEVIFLDLSSALPESDINTCLSIVNLELITSAGLQGEKFTIRSLSGNVSKLMGDVAIEFSEFLFFLYEDVYKQRYLSLAKDWGLDIHGQDVKVFRLGRSDEDFRGEIELAKTWGKGAQPEISSALISFGGLTTTPVFIEWYNINWILNQSALPNECILGAIKGIGKLMSECQIVGQETTKTLDEFQSFVDKMTPIGTYIRIRFIDGEITNRRDVPLKSSITGIDFKDIGLKCSITA